MSDNGKKRKPFRDTDLGRAMANLTLAMHDASEKFSRLIEAIDTVGRTPEVRRIVTDSLRGIRDGCDETITAFNQPEEGEAP